jgi:hypothetical protein
VPGAIEALLGLTEIDCKVAGPPLDVVVEVDVLLELPPPQPAAHNIPINTQVRLKCRIRFLRQSGQATGKSKTIKACKDAVRESSVKKLS